MMLRASEIEIDRLPIEMGEFAFVEAWTNLTGEGNEHRASPVNHFMPIGC